VPFSASVLQLRVHELTLLACYVFSPLVVQVIAMDFLYIMVAYQTSCGTGAGLRSGTKENKAQIVQEVIKNVWPDIKAGKVKTVINEVFPLGKAAEAHRAHHAMERSHFGKILLTC